jgi:Ni/Co efflux regulator RcnB
VTNSIVKESSMKRTITAAILISLIAGTAAWADSDKGSRRNGDARQGYESRWDGRSDRRDVRGNDRRDARRDHKRDDRHYRNDRRDDRRDWRQERRRVHVGAYHFPRGYRHNKWRRGDRLPRAYYARPYVVNDYYGYRLHAPPRGYHWVRVNHDVVLAAIATGVVLDVLYNHFH